MDDLPVPLNSDEARNLGRSIGYAHVRAFHRRHPEWPHPPIELVNLFRASGERVALNILRDRAPWTFGEFKTRIALDVEATLACTAWPDTE